MASTVSGSIKIQGLSGTDTDFKTMIDQLEQIEMSHALQLDKWKSDWTTRLDAFKQVQAAMVEYSSILKDMNSIEKFMVKNVLNSNSGVCSATATGTADDSSHIIDVKQKASNSYSSIILNVADKLASVNDTGVLQKIMFKLGDPATGTDIEVNVPPNCTLEGLKNIINNEFGSPGSNALGMRVNIISLGNNQQMLQLYSTSTGANTQITYTGNPAASDTLWGSGTGGMNIIANDWTATAGKDAWVSIDGWPAGNSSSDPNDPANWLTLPNNTITHIPGLNINIQGTGTTVLDVSLDAEAVTEHIQTFVDATNELRMLMKELTDYNPTAQTIDSDYAESQFETQKGGVLMGNYGMQLMMSKMKSFIFSKPAGFEYLIKDEFGQAVSGDTFASLAHIGIKTDDEQGSPTYGLLIFEDNIKVATGEGAVELITFEQALRMNAQGIAELFSADGAGTVDGYNFGYSSYLKGITIPGAYDVQYKVDSLGNVTDATVNGQAANYDPATSQITVVGDGDARGIVLDIYNKNDSSGEPGGYHTGAVRIKEGFLPGLITMVDSDFLDPDSDTGDAYSQNKDTKKGTLSVLISQYQAVIKNINTKIAKEDERLTLWRQRTELRFANLEATLSYYTSLQSQLESQINSMSNAKK